MSITAPSSAVVLQFQPTPPNQGGGFVKLRHAFLRSPAWQNLPPVARALYLEIASGYNGRNNGHIPYSVRDGASALRVSKSTVSRGLDLLKDSGLIRCASSGSFDLKTKKSKASEWELTEYSGGGVTTFSGQNGSALVALRGPAGPSGATGGGLSGPSGGTKNVDKSLDIKIDREKGSKEASKGNPTKDLQSSNAQNSSPLANPPRSVPRATAPLAGNDPGPMPESLRRHQARLS
jgi:hypothetical protein